jgi:hypothetical protein
MRPDEKVVSILGEAMEAAESLDSDDDRIIARGEIGRLIQALRLEAAFGSYAADAVVAMHRMADRRAAPNVERKAQFKRIEEVDAQAKRRLLSGGLSGAEALCMSVDDLWEDHEGTSRALVDNSPGSPSGGSGRATCRWV